MPSIPLPGQPVRGSKTGKPIMALLDLLGRTWALGIIWHLSKGNASFRQLQDYCEAISPTLLNTRLKELKATALITNEGNGYQLTELGQSLFALIEPMGKWSLYWQQSIESDSTSANS
ncbi:winged helix-turn-helix transcriptional regulator [Thalassotalea fusca]